MMQAKAGVMAYLFEYHRLSGVGPSLMEVASKDVMLEVLSRAFSTSVQPSDLKFIRYRHVGKGVELEDMAGRLGGILTSVEPQDADPKALIAFLKKHGAKTFKAESLGESIANTILKQMGGAGRLRAMIGAKHFVDGGDTLSFKFPNRKRSRGNGVRVTLRPDDTYDMEFLSIAGSKIKTVKKYSGIYADQLISTFENQTGLYLHL